MDIFKYLGAEGKIIKSFYITVEENTGNEPLDTIILKIGEESTKQQEKSSKQEKVYEEEKPKTILPRAGISKFICIIVLLSIILLVIHSIKLVKYKDVK